MKTVLIVDDSALMRRMMRYILRNNGYKIVGEATNGAVGVHMYSELLPDIVTMDLVMDEMGGMEALVRIIEINPDANVFVVSSMGQGVIVREALAKGARAFIPKPYDEKQVIKAFESIL